MTRGPESRGSTCWPWGGFTHPAWLAELRTKLDDSPGELFSLSSGASTSQGPRFILGTEVSCVYAQGGRTRRIHLLLYAPNFEAVDRLCAALARWGELTFDGRPTLGLSGRDLVETAMEADPRCIVFPAHAWTPWYGVFGSRGGFDSLEECFGDRLPQVTAVETGLSSDPAMNWRVPELDGLAIVSFSDAHSPARLGREVTVFDGELSYEGFRQALATRSIACTVEFFPEEGKYHFNGHRRCQVCLSPDQTLRQGDRCPNCGRRLTLGVAHRLEALAGRREAVLSQLGLLTDPAGVRPPFIRVVPLQEVLAATLGKGTGSKAVRSVYQRLVEEVGSELHLLQSAPLELIAAVAGERVAEGLGRVRGGGVSMQPGYDGVYGTVHIWPEDEKRLSIAGQATLL